MSAEPLLTMCYLQAKKKRGTAAEEEAAGGRALLTAVAPEDAAADAGPSAPTVARSGMHERPVRNACHACYTCLSPVQGASLKRYW